MSSSKATSSSTRSSASKKSSSIAKPTQDANAPAPEVVGEMTAVVEGPEMKKKELIEAVCARTDVKRKFAKPVIEAMMEVLGEAIAEGRVLNLQPMGKMVSKRSKETANARVSVLRVRQSKSAGITQSPETVKEAIADEAE